MEELLDPRQQLMLRVDWSGGGLVAHALELALPAGEEGRDLLGPPRPGLEEAPHGPMIDDPAGNVRHRRAGGVPPVAGHQGHLAEDVSGAEAGDVAPAVAAQDLHVTTLDDEERVAGIALPDDLLALREQ